MSEKENHIAEQEAQEKLGFTPPAFKIAEKIGEDFKNVIGDYYRVVYTEDVIPLKYKYLMAIATGIIAEHKSKVMVDTKKALQFGATKEEVLEVLKMCIWWNGAPTMMNIVPDVLNYLEKDRQSELEASYKITDECILCGTCEDECPENAISGGEEKFEINQELCIKCGACTDVCPVGAIIIEE